MDEPVFHIQHRETLGHLLGEAAEIEHGLMCCYLYAAFSIGAPTRGRVSEARAAVLSRWREQIVDVAREEMVHLVNVSNVASSVGVAPHLQRPNFPVSPGYHPAGVVVSLAPFSRATIDHFVFLERPEGVSLPDGEGFASPRRYRRGMAPGRLTPSAEDYATVGHLYRGIRAGLDQLADQMGESVLFCGNPALQLGAPPVTLPGTSSVLDLEGAHRAIDVIVTQGEGADDAGHESHYCRFVRMRDELAAMQAEDPSFDPAAHVARNPVMRRPPVPEGLVWIDAEPAASVLDVGNAMYMLMLRALEVLFSPVAATPGLRGPLYSLAVASMSALTPIGELLTSLPASASHPGIFAGLSFATSRTLAVQPDPRGAVQSLVELSRSIARGLEQHVLPLAADARPVAERIGTIGDRLATLATTLSASHAPAPVVVPVAAAASAPAVDVAVDVDRARGKHLEIHFDTKRCIHSRHCVLGAPRVFLANVQGPWLHPDEASVEALVGIAHTCPSGAITYERLDGGPPEPVPEVNVMRLRENGPYAVHADVRLAGRGTLRRATLCRCGASQNKPFCDGSHNAASFRASGEPATIDTAPLAERGGALEITPLPDGPLEIGGSVEICAGTGRTIARVESARLCRCGGSANKPFCDGTHARIGFRAGG
jgi:CDGSH-type Zn-finger protein/uncharacterized Fe-S cluster protein YjdI